MHNAIDKPVPVNLGRAEVLLKFDWNAIAALEEQSGRSLSDLLGSKGADGTFTPGQVTKTPASVTRLLVWAAVQHQMPGASVADIGSLMTMEQGPAISAALMAALGAQTANPNGSANGTGDHDPNPPATTGP
jgi:hypothetical protein